MADYSKDSRRKGVIARARKAGYKPTRRNVDATLRRADERKREGRKGYKPVAQEREMKQRPPKAPMGYVKGTSSDGTMKQRLKPGRPMSGPDVPAQRFPKPGMPAKGPSGVSNQFPYPSAKGPSGISRPFPKPASGMTAKPIQPVSTMKAPKPGLPMVSAARAKELALLPQPPRRKLARRTT